MMEKAAPLLLPLPPLALTPAALLLRPLLRLLDSGLQILIKLNNLKNKPMLFYQFTHFNKKNSFSNAPGDAMLGPPQNVPYVHLQHVTFGPKQEYYKDRSHY